MQMTNYNKLHIEFLTKSNFWLSRDCLKYLYGMQCCAVFFILSSFDGVPSIDKTRECWSRWCRLLTLVNNIMKCMCKWEDRRFEVSDGGRRFQLQEVRGKNDHSQTCVRAVIWTQVMQPKKMRLCEVAYNAATRWISWVRNRHEHAFLLVTICQQDRFSSASNSETEIGAVANI